MRGNYQERIQALYDKLSRPKMNGVFHSSPTIEASVDSLGNVDFRNKRSGFTEPQEVVRVLTSSREKLAQELAQRVAPIPKTEEGRQMRREIASEYVPELRRYHQRIGESKSAVLSPRDALREASALQASFNTLLDQPDSKQVFLNSPIGGLDGKRAAIYRRSGFVDIPLWESQALDNRRFSNFPAIERLYAERDPVRYGEEVAAALQTSREQQRSGRLAGTRRAKSAEYYIQPQKGGRQYNPDLEDLPVLRVE